MSKQVNASMTPAQALAWAKRFSKVVAAFSDLHTGMPVDLVVLSVTSLAARVLTSGGVPRELVPDLVAQIVSTLPGEVEKEWAAIDAGEDAR